MPHAHGHVLADWHRATPELVDKAIAAATAAQREWASWPWEDRAAVFLKAAELLSTTWRSTINAATMLGQSKTAHQAEIDAACELIDFLALQRRLRRGDLRRAAGERSRRLEPPRLASARGLRLRRHAVQLHRDRRQPVDRAGADGQHRAVEAGGDARCSRGWYIFRLLEEAGLPPGVINFVPGNPRRDLEDRARAPRSRRHPLHRQHRRLRQPVEDRRREHRRTTAAIRASSARPAARTSSSPTRRPIPRRSRSRSSAAASSTRARSARRRAASTSRDRCGARSATAPSA